MEMSVSQRRPRRRNPVVDFFASIWLGIILIVLIFTYAAVGSAVPVVRQFFELNEFQFFNHWIFTGLILLFCINLIVATVVRIKFNMINAGVLTVHAGLLLLCGASIWYFGSKVEGDVLMAPATIGIYSNSRLQSGDQGAAKIGQVVAAKGRVWEQNIPMLGGAHRVEVVDVKNFGMQMAQEVTLKISAPNQPEKQVTLSTDNSTDQFARIASVSPKLTAMLQPADAVYSFYDNTVPCLSLLVGTGDDDRREFNIPSLPYYSERFVSLDDTRGPGNSPVTDLDGHSVKSKRTTPIPLVEHWKMPVPVLKASDPLAKDLGFTLDVDGYLPYATMDNHPVEGGDQFSPMAQVAIGRQGNTQDGFLFSQFPQQAQFEANDGTRVEFDWIGDKTEPDANWTRRVSGRHILEVDVKDKDIHKAYDVKVGDEIAVEGTDYKLKIEQLRPNWPLMTSGLQGARTGIALVWVASPEKQFQRSVLARFPELDQDRNREGKKIDPKKDLVDDNIVIRYTNASTDHIRLVAGENYAPTIIHTRPGGEREMKRVKEGEPVTLAGNLDFVLRNIIKKPRLEQRPLVIPEPQRRSLMNVGRQNSMVRVHLKALDGSWSRRQWVNFSQYDQDHTSVFGGTPTVVRGLPEGRAVAFVYGRQRNPLPAPLVLEQLKTEYYPGGEQPKEWTSYFRYKKPGTDEVREGKAFLNNTYTVGNWTFFQSAAAKDGESWTVLGVGNRNGVLLQLLACAMITLGMIYAFAVKPVLKKRRKARIMANQVGRTGSETESDAMQGRKAGAAAPVVAKTLLILGLTGLFAVPVRADEPVVHNNAIDSLKAIEGQIDVDKLGAIAMLDNKAWRFTTIESWARKTMRTMHGSISLGGLDPVVSAMELMFNGKDYLDQPVIYVKDKVILKDLTKYPIKVPPAEARRMYNERRVSYKFLTRDDVQKRIQELSGEVQKNRAMNRMASARFCFEQLHNIFTIVPQPNGDEETPWMAPVDLMDTNSTANAGITEPMRMSIINPFSELAQAWRNRDVKGINAGIAKLDAALPKLAPKGLYPSLESRLAEQRYRRLDLMWVAWLFYIGAFFVSIFAVATRYRWAIGLAAAVVVVAVGLHGYDIWMRWGVLGRIPNANMYEAVTFSAWCGAVFGLLLAVFLRKPVLVLASATVGFLALALPEFVPDTVNNDLQTMMPILDDAMLRIHTTLIITSYQVITLAFAVANCYLVVAAIKNRSKVARVTIGAQIGAAICVLLGVKGYMSSMPGIERMGIAALMLVGGGLIGMGGFRLVAGSARTAAARAFDVSAFPVEKSRSILDEFDLCLRVLIYTATVALFVGTILGAIWADYSWGRPWGWDPKEVFAMNTWLIYAILIHVRFVTKNRALWTSVLSVIGFAVMLFNWFVVNFYIVGLHSYA